MRFPDLVELAKKGAEGMKPVLGPGDDWEPMLCLVSSKKQILVPLRDMMGSETTKDLLANVIIPMAIEEAEADAFFMVLSSWMVSLKVKPESDAEGYVSDIPRPSEHPDRVETLILQIADQHNHKIVSAEIIRDEQGVPRLGEWSDFPDALELGGRFFDAPMKALRRLHEKNN